MGNWYFRATHPECIGVFAFDNATSHKAFSEDALVASKMNLGPGGSAPKMQETVWSGGRQSMIIENDHIIYNNKKKTYVNFREESSGFLMREVYGVMVWCLSVFRAKKKKQIQVLLIAVHVG